MHDDLTGEHLVQTFTAAKFVGAMTDMAKMLNRYKVSAHTVTGTDINLTCDECEDIIWSSRHKARDEWSLLRLNNIAHEHEHMLHMEESGVSHDGNSSNADNAETRTDVRANVLPREE